MSPIAAALADVLADAARDGLVLDETEFRRQGVPRAFAPGLAVDAATVTDRATAETVAVRWATAIEEALDAAA